MGCSKRKMGFWEIFALLVYAAALMLLCATSAYGKVARRRCSSGTGY